MTPQDIQTIHNLLMNRVQPQNVREGVAIAQLAAKLVAYFMPNDPPPKEAHGDAPIT